MNWMPVKLFVRRGMRFLTKHSPTILTVMGTGGVVSSVVMAVKATPKAQLLLEKKKKELQKEKLTPVETVKACWTVYLPTAGMMATTIGCVVGANCINLKRNAALASLLAASRHEFGELHQKMVETIGKEKTEALRDEVQKKLAPEPATEKRGIDHSTPMRCVDGMTGQEFTASRDQLNALHYLIRDMIHNEGMISKNEALELLNQRPVDDGNDFGWTDQTGFEMEARLQEDDQGYYYAVKYLIPPVERYGYLY